MAKPNEDTTVQGDAGDATGPGADATSAATRLLGDPVAGPFVLHDGTHVRIRPIQPDDEPAMVRFHESLSDQSVYLRYFHPLKLGYRVAHDRLARICQVDSSHEMVLVAERTGDAEPDILVVGRLTTEDPGVEGEFAIVVSDAAQGQGLGTEILRRLVAVGRLAGLARITGQILPENRAMQAVAEKVGFTCLYVGGDGIVRAELTLEPTRGAGV